MGETGSWATDQVQHRTTSAERTCPTCESPTASALSNRSSDCCSTRPLLRAHSTGRTHSKRRPRLPPLLHLQICPTENELYLVKFESYATDVNDECQTSSIAHLKLSLIVEFYFAAAFSHCMNIIIVCHCMNISSLYEYLSFKLFRTAVAFNYSSNEFLRLFSSCRSKL